MNIDHDWEFLQILESKDEDRPNVIEEKRTFVDYTWLRWKCEDCGRVLRTAAPCELFQAEQIRNHILDWEHDITYGTDTYCCGELFR